MTTTKPQSAPPRGAPLPRPLLAVDRAVAELRIGGDVLILGADGAVLAQAAEAVTAATLERLSALASEPPMLAVTARRAAVMGLDLSKGHEAPDPQPDAPVLLHAPQGLDARAIGLLSDPCAGEPAALPDGMRALRAERSVETAAVALMKLARLLPAAVLAPTAFKDPAAWAREHDVVTVTASQIVEYQQTAARSLTLAGTAKVPLAGAERTTVHAFRPADGGMEHLAIVIGAPDYAAPVLVRLHSECFTGDLLASLRCDCGDQLRGAIDEIARAGSGVLLYLAQEGRGIGLVNKLRAYQLQDKGLDTLDANGQLGFDDDERIYQPAAEILRLLGCARVRMLTNNPAKVAELARHGITVVERVPHVYPANPYNRAYLATKAGRGGHLF